MSTGETAFRGRWPHLWFIRRMSGGVICGRCGTQSATFCIVDGKPEVHAHHAA